MGIIINGKQEDAKILDGKPFVVSFASTKKLDIEYCYTTMYTDPLSFKIETQNAVSAFLKMKNIYGEIMVSWYPIVMGAIVSCKDNCTTVFLKETCYSCNTEEKNELDLMMHANGNKYCKICMEKL